MNNLEFVETLILAILVTAFSGGIIVQLIFGNWWLTIASIFVALLGYLSGISWMIYSEYRERREDD